jgi:hypothetical protein
LEYPYGRALVAESGASLTSSNVVEQMGKFASDKSLFDRLGMRGIASQAVREIREQLRLQNFECSSEELCGVIGREALDAALMIAHYDDRPRIDTIRFTIGIANRAQSFFETIGSGADLATYLLTDLCTPEMDYKTASVCAVYVVEIVKRHDPYCGGPTRLSVLHLPSPEAPPKIQLPGTPNVFDTFRHYYAPPILLDRSETDEIVKMALEVEEATKKQRAETIRDALKQKSKKRLEELMKLD